jgi:DNA gyrase subunit A
MVITTHGYGKRTPLDQYPLKGRATKGVATINQAALEKIGYIVSARVVQEADDLTIISANGVVLRMKVKDISRTGRATRGVLLIQLQPGDIVASMARMAEGELRRQGIGS